jgi:sigma-E factor negative regulatory protein RseA
MNAEQDRTSLNLPGTGLDSALSALADGELSDAELDALLLCEAEPRVLQQQWLSYQIIGQAIQGRPVAGSPRSSQDFLAGVMAGLPVDVPQSLPKAPDVRLAHVRPAAANDPVMRWKWVAGMASLAAVMAVSWTVLRDAPTATDAPSGAVLAGDTTPRSVDAVQAPAPVLVTTSQGTLIRDARLEQLLAEHRQYGSMSALQMPAGFLRSATHDAAERR